MPRTRHGSKSKFQYKQKHKHHQHSKQPYDLVQSMMQEMSENNLDPSILIPTNSKIEMMEEELQRKSFILIGPGHSGKTAAVHWFARNYQDNKHIIWLDCRFWQTDSSFIVQLLQEVSLIFKRQLPKNLVVSGDISFKELNKAIEKQGIELVIVIKNPQKLIQQKRPVILYNIFEWMNSNQSNQYLNFILITKELRFIDNRQKRIKSRMNSPIIFLARPKADKIKEILIKRVQHCAKMHPEKEALTSKLKRALEQKQIQKAINTQYEQKAQPISFYLKILQLILAIGIQSQQKWELMNQKEMNSVVCEGFQTYSKYIVDHRSLAKSFFSSNHIPQIILMGLYRCRFLRQKEGNYTCSISLGQLMNDYNIKKSRARLQQGGSSFLYSERVMQGALLNLIEWNFLTFSKNQKISIINRQIDSRYGPEDIEHLYRQVEFPPAIVKEIYNDS